MTLVEWTTANGCQWVRTVPGRSTQEPAKHIVHYQGDPKQCRIDPVGLVKGDNGLMDGVFVDNHPVHWSYEVMPRYWRERLFPDNFARWTEAEHHAKPRGFSWEDQQTIWAHKEAWEEWIDGGMTLEATRAYVANLAPLPKVASIQTIVRSKLIRWNIKPERERPALTPEQEKAMLDMLPKIPEPVA